MILNLEEDQSLDLWVQKHWCGVDPDDDALSGELIPLNPHESLKVLSAIAIHHAKGAVTHKFPTPNIQWDVESGNGEVSVWYFDVPISPGQKGEERATNLYYMVAHDMMKHLQGVMIEEVYNPLTTATTYNTQTMTLKEMAATLKSNGMFNKTQHPIFLSRGGLMTTLAQSEARSKNYAKAREAAMAVKHKKKIERAQYVMSLKSKDLSNEEIAALLGIAVTSVPMTVWRAQEALGLDTLPEVPVEAPKPVEAHVEAPEVIVEPTPSLEALLASLEAEEKPKVDFAAIKAEEKFPHKRPTSVSEDDLLAGLDIDF